jgi:hypothetical protein
MKVAFVWFEEGSKEIPTPFLHTLKLGRIREGIVGIYTEVDEPVDRHLVCIEKCERGDRENSVYVTEESTPVQLIVTFSDKHVKAAFTELFPGEES